MFESACIAVGVANYKSTTNLITLNSIKTK